LDFVVIFLTVVFIMIGVEIALFTVDYITRKLSNIPIPGSAETHEEE
jgi:hypothetical protein